MIRSTIMNARRDLPPGAMQRVQRWPELRPDAVARGRARVDDDRWPSCDELAVAMIALCGPSYRGSASARAYETRVDLALGPTLTLIVSS